MNTTPFHSRNALPAVFLCCLLGLAAPLAAQQKSDQAPAKGQLLEISLVIIRPDKVAEYERLQKEQVSPALQKAGGEARSFFKGGAFNDGYLYGTVVPVKSFAYFDETKPLEKVLGKSESDALIARIAACHVSKRVFIVRQIPDLSWGQHFSPVAVVVVNRAAPGRKAEFIKFLREQMIPVVRKSDLLGFSTEEHVLGGNTDEVYTLGFWRNYADLEKGPPALRVLGEKGYEQLMQKLPNGVLVEREARVIEFRADMSFGPAVKPASGQ